MSVREGVFRDAVAAFALASLLASAGCGKSSSTAATRGPDGGQGGAFELAGAAGEGGAPTAAGEGGAVGAPEGGAFTSESGAGGQAEAGQGGSSVAPLPPGLALSAVTISQTLELPLVRAGVGVPTGQRPTPLIAGKRALVRAFVTLEPGFEARPLIGVLDLKLPSRTRTLVSNLTVAQSSLQEELGTTFVFDVEAADLDAKSAYRVRVLEADTTPLARFPESGYSPLDARVLPGFTLVVVPFVIGGFAPKLGESELLGLRQRMLALLPSMDVSLDVAKPVTLPYAVEADGDGWDEALDEIYALRAAAAPAHDVFYFGAMAPATSYNAYCAESCTLGYSAIADETDVDLRGSIGVTVFQDGSGVKDAWDTVVHELGHAMGRDHAPCGISDPGNLDSAYPYANAGLGGIYGFDFDAMKLVKPKSARDVMSYCSPVWISDYTYRGLFERLDFIAGESFRILAFAPHAPFRLARIRRTGETAWLGERYRRASAQRVPVELVDVGGAVLGRVEGELVRLDHARGGYVWLPAQGLARDGAHSVDLRPYGGEVLPL